MVQFGSLWIYNHPGEYQIEPSPKGGLNIERCDDLYLLLDDYTMSIINR